MISLKKRTASGFTIVELLIVIVIIGILAALVITTYSGIQQKARDTERKTDLNTLQSHAEAYFAESGKYPCTVAATSTCAADFNSAAFRSSDMKGLDPAALADPKNAASQQLCTAATSSCYGYVAAPAGCDDAGAGDCTSYTLTADLETGGTYVKQSLN